MRDLIYVLCCHYIGRKLDKRFNVLSETIVMSSNN